MNVRPDVRLDKAQFFAWTEHQDRRYELADGRVVLLPFVTRGHYLICSNILLALGTRLDAKRFGIALGDFAVETGEDSIRYADVMVEPRSSELDARGTRDALVLAEVLSASTMHIDFGEKLDEYRRLPDLGTYFICAQDQARVWAWTRVDGRWPDVPDILEGLDALLELPVLGIGLSLGEIYRNVVGAA